MCFGPYLFVPQSVTIVTRKQGAALCHAVNKESFAQTFECAVEVRKSGPWRKVSWANGSGHPRFSASLHCFLLVVSHQRDESKI